ncbi:MAG: aspartate aminotransferase family protein [Acidobacteriaceae bacterium]|nr:aspartate aminotransferase family protein [Acidobacteriaceae bacterium]
MPAAVQQDQDINHFTRAKSDEQYSAAVNPYWVRLLKLLQMDVRYERCVGTELFTADGRRILDFLSGYCVHNLGHNHPAIIESVKDELERRGPAMLQSHVPELAGELAARLCALAGGDVRKVFFCSSGSEGVEAAIKFAKAHTKREGLLYAEGAFHGLTCGALSLMGDAFWKQGFGELLPGTQQVPFDDLDALERELKTKRYAALFLEPIQGEAGIRVPHHNYLKQAQALCKRYGTLLVLDEVQTGFHRTGKFLAAHHYGVDADMIVLAKAISGGLVPSGAVLMTEAVHHSVYGSLRRSLIHTSTYSENGLAMRAGLAVLDALEREKCEVHCAAMGHYVRQHLRKSLGNFEMVEEVRGEGLFSGIAFRAPKKLSLRVPFEVFVKVHPAMFGQVLVMRLFRDHGILAQICGNNFMVLKVAPPLTVTREQIDTFVDAVAQVVALAHSPGTFWSEALGLARRVTDI